MADPFSSFARAPGAPYTRAVALVESPDEIEVTAALYCNGQCQALLVFADSETPIWLTLEAETEYAFRVRKVLAMQPNDTVGIESEGYTPSRIVGLY